MTGLVTLVGAGPGAADLLTVRAVRRLAEADLVLHDALVPDAILALAPQALRASVGKRARQPSTSQERIHRILIRAAHRGVNVVRLKGGDPFVFGRGGEEVAALAAAGIPCEVIPGLSSCLAAPALAGIPVTHRGLASAFAVVSGHAEATYGPILESLPPGAMTVVVLMGLASRSRIAELLMERGWSPYAPAAILMSASTEETCSWTGELADLGRAAVGEGPGTIVIGDVVSLSAMARQRSQMKGAHHVSSR